MTEETTFEQYGSRNEKEADEVPHTCGVYSYKDVKYGL